MQGVIPLGASHAPARGGGQPGAGGPRVRRRGRGLRRVGDCGSEQRKGDAHGRPLRHVRLQGGGSLRRVHDGPPERHDQGNEHRVRAGLLPGPADPPRGRRRTLRRPGDRGGPYRRGDSDPGGQVRRPPRSRRRRPREHVLPVEVGSGNEPGRRGRRSGHGHGPACHLLPDGSLQASRSADGSRRARLHVGDVARLHRSRQAVRCQGAGQLCLHGQRLGLLQRHHRPVRVPVLRRGRQPDLRLEPSRQGRVGPRRPGDSGRAHRKAEAVRPAVEPGVRERPLRNDRVPRLDDRLHQGPGRRCELG